MSGFIVAPVLTCCAAAEAWGQPAGGRVEPGGAHARMRSSDCPLRCSCADSDRPQPWPVSSLVHLHWSICV
ncbi:hypothetical protein FQA47_007036 [Oryzias melastigma]|uniref:Uncharacterized protein n=1 Tax=Oryzias melastigma TaxID=30732 RepID=A0A834BY16_ORYME|nr:hypothetical protein FQA47_007036 [Oryzias melastigma]